MLVSKEFMDLSDFELIDLTHPLDPGVPTWNGSCGFSHEIKKDYNEMFRVQKLKMHAGVGTHMDAPSHRIPGGRSIAQIPLKNLLAPLCILDVKDHAHADYLISPSDIKAYENTYGRIPKRAVVIGFTGWSRFWKNPDAYRNVDSSGKMHFPGFSKEAAKILLERQCVGIGIDTLSPDCLDETYPVHELFLSSDKYILENIADCSAVPYCGAWVIALPLPAIDCTECPSRVVALINKKDRL